jgi:hypothetical protein
MHNKIELHLSGLSRTTSHPDMRKNRIIGFFSDYRLHGQFEVEKNFYNDSFRLHIDLLTNETLIHNFYKYLTIGDKNLSHK